MNAWLAATVALTPPFGLMLLMCARGSVVRRAAAVQMAGALGLLMLVAMTFAFGQASSIDLALTLALLALPAALLFAIFLERWL